MAFSLIWLEIDGQEEKKLTFTELYLHLEWYLIQTEASLIGQNLELWRGSIRKLMIAWRNICTHSCLCVGGFAVFLPKKVYIKFLFCLVSVKEAESLKFRNFQLLYCPIQYASSFSKIVNKLCLKIPYSLTLS